MYRSVYDMAVRLGLTPTPGFRQKQVKAHIVLDSNGNYQMIAVSDDPEKTLCPDSYFPMKGFTGNDGAKFLTDYAAVVVYSEDLSSKDKFRRKHKNYVAQIHMGKDISALSAIDSFLQQFDTDSDLRERVIGDIKNTSVKPETDVISFRIDTVNVENDASWKKWYQEIIGSDDEIDGDTVYSSVTGKRIIPVKGKFPQLKGGKAGSGIPVFSDSMRGPGDSPVASTKSYGSDIACPMSEEEAGTIIRGLDYILNDADQYSADFNVAWWYDTKITQENDVIRKTSRWTKSVEKNKRETKEEKYRRLLKENIKRSKEYGNLLRAAENGDVPEEFNGDHKYHIVTISFPEKGRMMSEGEYEDTYKSLYSHLNQWYLDGSLETSFFDKDAGRSVQYDRTIKNIYEVLFALKLNSSGKEDKSRLFRKEKTQLLRAVYQGGQIPHKFMELATDQYTRYLCRYTDDQMNSRYVSRENALCILSLEKIFLTRNGGYVMGKELTPANESKGYQCGRWLAVVDKLQEESLRQTKKSVNSSLSSRFYKQAKKTPAKSFAILNDYIKVYEDRLSKVNPKANIRYDRLFGEISENIGTYFPERLSVAEQGAFDLGFAQQKQAFYKKNATNEDTEE